MKYGLLLAASAFALAATSATLTIGSTETHAKNVNIKLSYWVPPRHKLTPGYKEWAAPVKKASGGTITTTLFPSSQLGSGRDHYDMVKRGIASFGLINPGYTPGRFPILGASRSAVHHQGQPGWRQGLDQMVQEVRGQGNEGPLRLLHLHP